MKERPILFNGEMVRAILEGRKTQTRRVIRAPLSTTPQWPPKRFDAYQIDVSDQNDCVKPDYRWGFWDGETNHVCRMGKPGDELWVRETSALCVTTLGGGSVHERRVYRADHPNGVKHNWGASVKWKPSIHMPRVGSRIQLVVKNVRVERLNSISKEDAQAEGIVFVDHGLNEYGQQNNGWNVKSRAERGPDCCMYSAQY